MHAESESEGSGAMNSLGDVMPSFFLFSFVSCLHFVCKVRQGTSPRSFGVYSVIFTEFCFIQKDVLALLGDLLSKKSSLSRLGEHKSCILSKTGFFRFGDIN